jgi:hypothetical protein
MVIWFEIRPLEGFLEIMVYLFSKPLMKDTY